ncbi:carbohydrate ABC transporter membrane protein 2 (CUT1 family) [Promicromonospora sp. AC04]|uniref:carbohydrate ABC transporter permease n=1 Tax=Promicromonospora sp. AC04 TaxID=2135723 RepID=UPI000D33C88F|nr:carbohydrate ABC transporter permease [Promicromonospora sp. AC04]PUB27597.1 carbohydrate ABC transporter membrane protein 2 (CUT1 family) [Promicromonospora sp. AC04]
MTSPLWRRIGLSAWMILLACVIGIPLYYIVVNTLKTQSEMVANPLALPTGLFLDNYREVLASPRLFRSFGNTVYVTAVSVAAQLVTGSLAAFAMLIWTSRWNRIVGNLFLLAFVVPGQATLIPLYRTLVGLELVDDLNGLVLMYMGGAIFCYFLIQGYMRTLPFEVIEAARLDGAGSLRIFWHIALPLIKPILVTVGIFQTMGVWNDFLIPTVFISSPDNRTVVLQVFNAVSEFATDWPMFMTVSVVALIPMVIFFVLTQRHIVNGLLAGSVKG